VITAEAYNAEASYSEGATIDFSALWGGRAAAEARARAPAGVGVDHIA
jgi:hypothetical protein